MKFPTTAVIATALMLGMHAAQAQSGGMQRMEMKGMEHKDMKGMDKAMSKTEKGSHRAVGVVKKIDPKAGTVTIAHEPVKTLNWPAMTMTFQVKDKALLDRFALDKKVEVEFEQRSKQNVINGVK